jgi:AraC-like DNA-binding protein
MARLPARRPDEYLTFGLESRRKVAAAEAAFHRHDEVELLYVESGAITHLFGGARVALGSGELVVFWGAIPHLPVAFEPGTTLHWLTVPLAWFLQWPLPAAFTAAILRGRVFRRRRRPESAATDLMMFNRWHADARSGSEERRRLMLLESEAFLRRLLVEGAFVVERRAPPTKLGSREADRVEVMASFIARHYTEPVAVADVARAAGLHPDYAGALFRKTCGRSLVDYLTEQRLSHAQRLLATTDDKIIDVALAAGFGSASRFYAAFLQGCRQTPRRFRARVRPGAVPLG